MGHGSTLKKVRNIAAMHERVASRYLLKVHPLDVMRAAALTGLIYDDVFNYSLPYDFGSFIDLYPDDNRTAWDKAFRNPAGQFDLEKAFKTKTISIEGNEGEKIARINWKSRQGKVVNTMDSLTANGAWSIVGGATGLAIDSIFKKSGNGSIRFNVNATGDGIQNTTMTAVDLTIENLIASEFVWLYLGADFANLTSITPVWGNDLTTKYWTGVPQTTQADGTPFRQGWNEVKTDWQTAIQTGVVAPASIDSLKFTFTVTAPLSQVRMDNVMFTIGRNFDMKYYSKFLFKSATSGLWISQPTSTNDIVMVDNDTLPLYLYECLKDMAQQMEGTDSAFDINYATAQLQELYPAYKGLYPSQVKKQVAKYGGLPRLRRSNGW